MSATSRARRPLSHRKTAEHPEAETRVDAALQAELGGLAVAKAREWTDRQAAAALLHLTIDAFIYLEQGKPVLGASTGETVAETPAPYDAPAAKPAPAPALPGTAPLPEVLRAVADEALGFLKDGHRVLLAGAPGTEKTTVAQWVAHAWNAGADRVPDQRGTVGRASRAGPPSGLTRRGQRGG